MNTETEVCVLCCRKIDFYAYGSCNHAVCHECCTRIRVLCGKTDCPICRQLLPEVYFSAKLLVFEKLDFRGKRRNSEYGIIFDTSESETAFNELLEHPCSQCPRKTFFSSFMQLKDHMRRVHERFYCNLCVDNTKLFSFERQVYTRNELSRHRLFGDSDNTSLRAHPLCQFCNERYMDEDELYRHLRKDHFFCHFCDADGLYVFYCDYSGLREHFTTEHYLCEEGNCLNEQFTSVFRSDIDYKAHKASVHNRNLSKAQAKQARTIDVNFLVTPRLKHNHHPHDDSTDKSSTFFHKKKTLNENTSEKDNLTNEKTDVHIDDAASATTFDATDFPTLDKNEGGKVESVFRPPVWQGGKKHVRTSEGNDFPCLTSNSPVTSSNWVIGNTNVTASESGSKSKKGKPTITLQPVRKHANVNDDEEFPSLSSNTPSVAPSNWVVGNVNVIPAESVPKPKIQKEKNTSVSLKSYEEFPVLKLTKQSGNGVISSSKSIPQNNASEWGKSLQKKNLNQNKMANNSKEVTKHLKKQDENKTTKSATKKRIELLAHQNMYEVLDDVVEEPSPIVTVEKKSDPPPVSFGVEDFPELCKPTTNSVQVTVQLPKPKPANVPREKSNKILKSIAKVSVKDDSFSLQGLADSLKTAKLTKKKNGKKNTIDENHSINTKINVNGVQSKSNENNNSKIKSNGKVNKSSGQSSELSSKVNFEALYNKLGKLYGEYIPPDNFQQRNFDLIKKIQVMFNNSTSSFSDFKTFSGEFRQNEITADHYYAQCLTLLGNSDFLQVFPELLVLLPDIRKQQELLFVNKELSKNTKLDVDKKVNVCSVCQQVLAKQDFAVHKLRHT